MPPHSKFSPVYFRLPTGINLLLLLGKDTKLENGWKWVFFLLNQEDIANPVCWVSTFMSVTLQLVRFNSAFEGGGTVLSNSAIQSSARYIHKNSEHFLIISSLKCCCLRTVHQVSCPMHNLCSMFPWVSQLSSMKSLWNKHLWKSQNQTEQSGYLIS